jgi:hypothetical protein
MKGGINFCDLVPFGLDMGYDLHLNSSLEEGTVEGGNNYVKEVGEPA